jgi:class 3 adenylate cyclase
MTERDRYLATILFTDIVGSTGLTQRLGDACHVGPADA